MKKKYVRHIVLVLYIIFIFSNSLTPAGISSEHSGFVLQTAHRLLYAFGIQALWLTEHVIRKCAHFAEYAVLGILLHGSMTGLPCKERLRGQIHLASIFFIPFVDETLQLFTEGRSGQISDVWLDMSGIVAGTILTAAASAAVRHIKSNNKK